MSPFSSLGGTVTQLRGLAWMSLTDTGYIGAGTITSDTGGGGASSWAYGGAIPCRVDPLGEGEDQAAARISDRSTHIITVPPYTPIRAANRFAVTGRGTFEVTAVQDPTGERVRFFEVVKIT